MTTTPLSVLPREAARMLAISERTLFSLSVPRGPIPCTRLGAGKGGCVLYRPEDLDRWLRESQSQPAA